MANIFTKTILFDFAVSAVIALAPISLFGQATTAKSGNETQSSANSNASTGKAPVDPRAHDDTYVIGIDDVLAINVWKEPEVSRTVPVRSDGRISLPLAGEVEASGSTPKKLEQEIAAKLKSYIAEPEVTVIVEQTKSQKFNILGMVAKPGAYPLASSPTVLDAIAAAGGFKDFAKQKSIYVLRKNPDGTESRIHFNYKDVIKGKKSDENVKLHSNDTIVVP